MTREEIMSMPAGPDLDRMVAEALGEDTSTRTEHQWGEVLATDDGCEFRYCSRCGETLWLCSSPDSHMETDPECVPIISRYSADIAPAWRVWEEMRQKVPYVQLCQEGAVVDVCVTVNERDGPYITATADTAPLAICRAFLVWKMEVGK